ncbi:MAG: hypothetical protein Alpg2KO_03120 [Alphaproteobacteria bacterium]
MTSKRIFAYALAAFSGLALTVTPHKAEAVDYVQSPPLSKVVTSGVRDCRVSDEFTLPLITWGADIVTIHANGGNTRTQGGSLFDQAGLEITLQREDTFTRQVGNYMGCASPFLRATAGMANLAADVTEQDPRSAMQGLYQHSWSNGGDALVVKSGIRRPADLRGKTIAVQAYGPHVDYLMTVLTDAGVSPSDVKVKWVRDLVGLSGSTPGAALAEDSSIDAAMVIIPDALALTSDGTVGTGSEGSVRGASILLSTRSANRVIADLYLARSDWLKANPQAAEKMVSALLKAEEEVRQIMRSGGPEKQRLMRAAARILLDAEDATADAEALWADAETVGWDGNTRFFADPNNPRGFKRLNSDIQAAYQRLALISRSRTIADPGLDWNRLKAGLAALPRAETNRFDADEVARLVQRRKAQGVEDDGTLFSFEVFFKPNQNEFPPELYRTQFERVVDLATTYGGAIISVEGHSDPLGFLRAKRGGQSPMVLTQKAQAGRNLSLARANAVRDSIVKMASGNGVLLDPSQFTTIGLGFTDPATGMCGSDPCAPKSEDEWRSNMRVSFKIIQVEAEAEVFRPLD